MSNSDNFIFIFVIFLLIIMFCMMKETKESDIISIRSKLNNKFYFVRNVPNKDEAADLLARICLKVLKLIKYMESKDPDNDIVKNIVYRFNPEVVTESSQSSKYTSYSKNKGQKIVLCLRAKDEEQTLIDENTLTFVMLHELGHLGTTSIGHGDEFWKTFKYILKHAIDTKIYTYQNFNVEPKKYCGIEITDQPLNNN
jgi:predicted metal-dependent hydrolase